jgi:hypothetical protein
MIDALTDNTTAVYAVKFTTEYAYENDYGEPDLFVSDPLEVNVVASDVEAAICKLRALHANDKIFGDAKIKIRSCEPKSIVHIT